MPEKVTLKYLFKVEYADGSIYEQTPDDVSRIDPEKRSEYYDVLQAVEAGATIRRFSLVGDGHIVTVDLGTGLFEVDGLRVLLESVKLPTLPDKFELIFYRQHTHDFNATYSTKTGNLQDADEVAHRIEYFIGWRCTIAGKNYEQKIAVA